MNVFKNFFNIFYSIIQISSIPFHSRSDSYPAEYRRELSPSIPPLATGLLQSNCFGGSFGLVRIKNSQGKCESFKLPSLSFHLPRWPVASVLFQPCWRKQTDKNVNRLPSYFQFWRPAGYWLSFYLFVVILSVKIPILCADSVTGALKLEKPKQTQGHKLTHVSYLGFVNQTPHVQCYLLCFCITVIQFNC